MTPQVLLVRHAPTALNESSVEAIRGHSDIPISGEGAEHLKQTGHFLSERHYPIRRILTSPFQRAVMTAEIIAECVGGAKVVPSQDLSPWDLGEMTGKLIKDVAPKMNHYQALPDLKVPQGESYRDFFDRWTTGLLQMLEYAKHHVDEVLVGVVHSRNLLALPSILGNRGIGNVPVKGGPEPCSVTRIYLPEASDDWKFQLLFEQKL